MDENNWEEFKKIWFPTIAENSRIRWQEKPIEDTEKMIFKRVKLSSNTLIIGIKKEL